MGRQNHFFPLFYHSFVLYAGLGARNTDSNPGATVLYQYYVLLPTGGMHATAVELSVPPFGTSGDS